MQSNNRSMRFWCLLAIFFICAALLLEALKPKVKSYRYSYSARVIDQTNFTGIDCFDKHISTSSSTNFIFAKFPANDAAPILVDGKIKYYTLHYSGERNLLFPDVENIIIRPDVQETMPRYRLLVWDKLEDANDLSKADFAEIWEAKFNPTPAIILIQNANREIKLHYTIRFFQLIFTILFLLLLLLRVCVYLKSGRRTN